MKHISERGLELINFNMGCFEMTVGEIVLRTGTGLTLTWDVLKFYEVYRGYN